MCELTEERRTQQRRRAPTVEAPPVHQRGIDDVPALASSSSSTNSSACSFFVTPEFQATLQLPSSGITCPPLVIGDSIYFGTVGQVLVYETTKAFSSQQQQPRAVLSLDDDDDSSPVVQLLVDDRLLYAVTHTGQVSVVRRMDDSQVIAHSFSTASAGVTAACATTMKMKRTKQDDDTTDTSPLHLLLVAFGNGVLECYQIRNINDDDNKGVPAHCLLFATLRDDESTFTDMQVLHDHFLFLIADNDHSAPVRVLHLHDMVMKATANEGAPQLSLVDYSILPMPGMELSSILTTTRSSSNHLVSRSMLLSIDNVSDRFALAVAVSNKIALLQARPHLHGMEWGLLQHYMLPYPAIGMGVVGCKDDHRLAVCLRGGTVYLIPLNDDDNSRMQVISYPHDLETDVDLLSYVQYFGTMTVTSSLLYVWPGGIVDIYASSLQAKPPCPRSILEPLLMQDMDKIATLAQQRNEKAALELQQRGKPTTVDDLMRGDDYVHLRSMMLELARVE